MKQELVQIPNGELEIQRRIKAIRGVQVMLDRDLAELYGVGYCSEHQDHAGVRRHASCSHVECGGSPASRYGRG